MDPRDKTTPRIRGTTPDVEHAARKLRRALTPAEQRLWQAIRGRQLGGLKFRCQHPVGWFVLDFYCPACKLAIELDGGGHEEAEQALRDSLRDEQLAAYGYRVLRFTNEEVLNDMTAVLHRISRAVNE
jgi:very-short-patch-repair endonuclease